MNLHNVLEAAGLREGSANKIPHRVSSLLRLSVQRSELVSGTCSKSSVTTQLVKLHLQGRAAESPVLLEGTPDPQSSQGMLARPV